MRELTAKQERFVGEYLSNGGNATQAAMKAYNCSAESARRIGSENLTKVDIMNAIQKHSGNILQDALSVVQDALNATTKNGKQHHSIRLRAADMVFRLSGTYARDRVQLQAEPERSTIPDLTPEEFQENLALLYFLDENDYRMPNEEELKEIDRKQAEMDAERE